jgi:hypothetical protein
MKRHLLTRILLLTATLIGTSADAATYYVDDVGGADGNSGTSAGAAWQTLTKVNSKTFLPGDQILFKAGGSWTGRLYL